MSRLHYLNEDEIRGLVEWLTRDLFPGMPAFQLAGQEGAARLESALAQPHWSHHRTAQQKAAVLHYSLNKNHPYVDGNKRLAVAAMEWFLFRNDFALIATNDQLVDFALRVADDRLSRDASAEWIAQRAIRSSWTDQRVQKWADSLSADAMGDMGAALAAAPPSPSGGPTTQFLESVRNMHQQRAQH